MAPRVVTFTVNPALDVAMQVSGLRVGHKIRASGETYDPGGGGINVSRVVHALGGETLAIFTTGGATGRHLRQLLSQSDVPCRSIPVAGETRTSVTVHDISTGSEYRFVPEGPLLAPADGERILSMLSRVRADWLVASGSLPPGLPSDFYARLAHLARKRGIHFALDTSGDALKAALHEGLDLLKTSRGEFDGISMNKPANVEALGQEASRLVAAGASAMIAVTLGGEGAILATADRHWFQPALAVPMRSSVGAGDSFLAGLVLGFARSQSPDSALRLATAAAAAAVVEEGTARVDVRRIEEFLSLCRI